jgi:hypothetical protein
VLGSFFFSGRISKLLDSIILTLRCITRWKSSPERRFVKLFSFILLIYFFAAVYG